MPIVVNPGFAWPPEVDPVVSPDGRITAIVDPAHAGVLLRADFDNSVPDKPAVPEKVLRRNLVTNPSLEASDVNWSAYAWTGSDARTQGQGAVGKWFYRLTATATLTGSKGRYFDHPIEVKSGETWTASIHVRPSRDLTLQSNVEVRSTAGAGGAVTTNTGPQTFCPANQWTRIHSTVTAGADGILIRHQAYLRSASLQSGDTLDLDAEMVALGALSPYFDGSTKGSGEKHYRYASDGTSEEYIPATPFIPGHGATTAKVRFERQDGTVVRSGNPAWAPGGYAHAYDHEATLGGGTLWRAVPIRFDGTEGTPSEFVGAVIPGLSDGWAWLKPVADPNKAMLLKVEPPDLSYDGRVDTTSIAGSARPAATWDVLEGFTTQLRSLVREKTVADQLMALLDEGPVLAQFPACAGLPDFYFIRGKVDLEHVHWDGYPWRRYQWDVISIDRPDTTDSPLRIPDLSYDTVERDWTTYDQLKSTVVSYNKLLEP